MKKNVFSDLGFDRDEALTLELKSQILVNIQKIVDKHKLSQRELQKLFQEPQPRISELMNGKISVMSLENLLWYYSKLCSATLKVSRFEAS